MEKAREQAHPSPTQSIVGSGQHYSKQTHVLTHTYQHFKISTPPYLHPSILRKKSLGSSGGDIENVWWRSGGTRQRVSSTVSFEDYWQWLEAPSSNSLDLIPQQPIASRFLCTMLLASSKGRHAPRGQRSTEISFLPAAVHFPKIKMLYGQVGALSRCYISLEVGRTSCFSFCSQTTVDCLRGFRQNSSDLMGYSYSYLYNFKGARRGWCKKMHRPYKTISKSHTVKEQTACPNKNMEHREFSAQLVFFIKSGGQMCRLLLISW